MLSALRHTFRQFGHSPGFTAVAIATLALGIGLSASSFSMANAFLLRNVPYADADRLVRIFPTTPQSQRNGLAPGNAIDVRESATSFAALSLYNHDDYALGEPGQPAEQVDGIAVSADFFNTLGVQPSLGRGFVAGEDGEEQSPIAVLTHRMWVRRFASDPDVIGRTIRLNARPCTIVGVMPTSFEAPLVWGTLDLIIPRTLPPGFRTNRRDTWMQAVARLKPEVSLPKAQAELSLIATRLEKAYPVENAGRGLSLVTLAQANMDSVSRSMLWLMTGIALAMLLIACANLASLQVARAFVRSREFAVRAALGGSRRQLMGPLLLESVVLAALGGIAGLFVASWSNDLIGRMLLIDDQQGFVVPIDARVLAFAAFASLLSGLAFGLAPAWLASRSPAAEALKEGARSATSSPSHQRIKRTLIVGELAIALTLVGIAAAFGIGARTFVHRDVGWTIDGLFFGRIALPFNAYGDEARSREFFRTLLPKLAIIPGVQHATLCAGLPIFSLGPNLPLTIEGQQAEDQPNRRPVANVDVVSPGFFTALEIPLRQGRIFSSSLRETDPPVAVVNTAFAERFWPGENPLGRRVRLGDTPQWIEVIGVVSDVGMLARLTKPDTPFQLYRPLIQSPTRYVHIVLRTAVAPETLTRAVQEAVASQDPDIPIAEPGSLRAIFDRNLTNLNLVILNLAVSAGMGLLIAAVGLFGVISQLTAQRTRDIGVRIALGAGYGDILRLIFGEGLRLLAVGIAIGIPAYYALRTVLHQSMPMMHLPGTWLLALNVTVLGGTMLLATYLPARRATHINPVDALRAE